MKREFGPDEIRHDPSSVVTIGTFDGVHRGHLAIMRYLIERARGRGGTSTVVSFDPHPREVLRGEPIPLLTTLDERAAILDDIGIDRFVVLPFTRSFSQMPARTFVEDVLVDRVGLQEVAIGYDHQFGRDREGNADLLMELGKKRGFTVDIIPAQVVNADVVSSSEIRRTLGRGEVRRAAEMLSRRYSFTAQVVEGDRRGRTIGFPTANLSLTEPRKIVPADGVYAVRVRVGTAGEEMGGMMNIGLRPTVDGKTRTLEVHLLNFDGNLYGENLQVEFVERLRDEKRFASLEDLTKQLHEDRSRCKAALESLS